MYLILAALIFSGCATGRILDNVTQGTTNEIVRELDHIKGIDYKLDETVKNADQNRRAIETAFESLNRIESKLDRMNIKLDRETEEIRRLCRALEKRKLISLNMEGAE